MALENNKHDMKLLKDNLKIKALAGERTIARASDVFKGWIDSAFKNYGTEVLGKKTDEANLSVYEMDKDATLEAIFGSISKDTDSLVLTQEQIIEFVKEYPDWLRKEGYATFFLFKVEDKFFVAYVYVYSDGLRACVYYLGDGYVWSGEYRHRVVVPQQTHSPSASLTLGNLDTLEIEVKISGEVYKGNLKKQ